MSTSSGVRPRRRATSSSPLIGAAPQASSGSSLGSSRVPVAGAGRLVRQEVREVRAHHDEGLVPAPHRLEDARHLRGARVAHDDRYEAEVAEDCLQERQVHLERVLQGVRAIALLHEGERQERRERLRVETDISEGRGECPCARHRGARHVHTMCRPGEDDAGDATAQGRQARVDRRGDRARIHVARVRGDDRLGRRGLGRARRGEISLDLGLEVARFAGIEGARNRGRPDGIHVHLRGAEMG
jgi:hypothetical protein